MPSFSKRLKKVFSASSRTDLRADALAQAEASKSDEKPKHQHPEYLQPSAASSSASTSTAILTRKKGEQKDSVSPVELNIREDAPPRYEEVIEQPISYASRPPISPWTLAFGSLSPDDAILLGHNPSEPLPTSELPSLNTTISTLQSAISSSLQSRWRITLPSGRTIIIRDLLEKLLLRVNSYLSIGNIMVQSDPGVAALVWGVVRFLVQVGVNQVEVYANLVKSLDGIVGLCARGRVYEGFYLPSEKESAMKVVTDLEKVYGLVLKYLVKCVKFFKEDEGKLRLGDPWTVKFGPLLDEIKTAEQTLEMDARVAGEEDQRKRDEKVLGLLEDTRGCLEGVIKPMLEGVSQRIDTLVDEMVADKRAMEVEKKVEILKWLGILPYGEWHRSVARSRMGGTGGWIIEREAFTQWRSEKRNVLWMHGVPGAGKTVLSSFIIDELKKDSNSVIAYFYCNYDDPNRQEPDLILAMLLKQLVSAMPTLPQALIKLYEAHKAEGFASARPDADELEGLILQVCNEVEKDCIIVIDALDELPQPARKRLYTFFTQLKGLEGDNKVSLFVTSRWLSDIKTHMTKASPFIIDIKEEDTSADIVQYIVSEVDKAVEEEELLEGEISEDLIEDIKDHLQKQAGGMFLWVRYQIAHLCEQESEYDIQEALTNLPTGLHDTYTRILHRIRSQSASRRRIAERTLRWMLSAVRPLTSAEITEATAIEAGDKKFESRKAPNSVATVLNVCGNLVSYDETLDVVRFSHLSVQEFLKTELGGEEEGKRMGEVCLTILCFERQVVKTDGIDSEELQVDGNDGKQVKVTTLSTTSLWNYACEFWPHYVRESKANGYGELFWCLISKLFSQEDTTYFDAYLETISLLDQSLNYQKIARHNPNIRPNPLFICAHYSLPTEISGFLLNDLSHDINSTDSQFDWPQLFLAASLLSVTALQNLLSLSANPSLTSTASQNIFHVMAVTTTPHASPAAPLSPLVPLLIRSILSHIPSDESKSLLSAVDNTGNTPLHLAATSFNLPFLLTLLTVTTPPSPTALNRQGRTPLQHLLLSLGPHPHATLQLKPVADIAMTLHLLTLSSAQHSIFATSGPGWLALGSVLKANQAGYKPQKQWLEEIGMGDIIDKDWGLKPVWARNNGRGPGMDKPKMGRWSVGTDTALGRAWKTPGTDAVRRDCKGAAVGFRGRVERWVDGKGGL